MNLSKEIRCGFEVTETRKRLRHTQLNILKEFDKICKKNKIKYFAIGGTLLGAVRHNGFIPWDDDIDVGMTRENYNKLLNLPTKEFGDKLFLQNSFTDKIIRNHSQIRLKGTTCLIQPDYFNKGCHGIFIDVFPFDYVPQDKNEYKQKLIALKEEYLNCMPKVGRINSKHKDILLYCYNAIVKITNSLSSRKKKIKKFKDFENNCANLTNETILLSCPEFYCCLETEDAYKAERFQEIIYLPFEDTFIPAPKNFDEVLKVDYGDYNNFVVGGGLHGDLFFDTEKEIKIPYSLKKYRDLFKNFKF